VEEERMLAQAIAKSRTDQAREPLTTIPFGPTYYPTIEEFCGDPLDYFETIRSEAEKYGKFVIVRRILLPFRKFHSIGHPL
jgi:histone demethylase JARID1